MQTLADSPPAGWTTLSRTPPSDVPPSLPSSQEPRPENPARAQTEALVRLAVERVASDPQDEQRYLELLFALDRAVERDLRYRELLTVFAEGALAPSPGTNWAWRLAAGVSANLMGDSPGALWWLEGARQQLKAGGRANTAAHSFVHAELARASYHSGDHGAAVDYANRALQIARAANSLQAEAFAHHYLGLVSTRRRDYDYARRQIHAARDLFARMNQRQGRARVLDSLAALEIDQGRYDTAGDLLSESLSIKEDLRDLRGQALTLGTFARLHLALGDYPAAMDCLTREREMIARVGDERNATLVRVQLGELHLRYGNAEQARAELLAAGDLARQRQNARLEAYAHFALAEAERQVGNREEALKAIEGACAYFDTSDEPIMRQRARIRRALFQGFEVDSPVIQEPLQTLRESGASSALADGLFEIATFFQDTGSTQLVTALYAEALDSAEPPQAGQFAAAMRARARSAEGRAWVDAMLTVKRHKDELEHALAELRRVERLRESLTQMIVHDLKNPLSAILPWLHTIQCGDLKEEEAAEYLQTAIDECDYLLRMIDDLNDAGKMQHEGRLDLHPEPLDLREMLVDVARRMQGRAADSGMRIDVEAIPELPRVPADRNKVRRVLENLTANAIKYGRPPEGSGRPPKVTLAAHLEPGSPETGPSHVRVEVRDYGEGVPLAEADRVFEPYYQAEAGRKRKAGVGLGLTFCRMVLDAHGGTIWTQPNPAGGSIFAFRLPVER